MLGHVQRGGTPTAFDRVLATRFGIAAIDAVHDRAFGQMVALQADQIVRVPLSEALASLKTVDLDLLARRGRGLLRVKSRSGRSRFAPHAATRSAGSGPAGTSMPPASVQQVAQRTEQLRRGRHDQPTRERLHPAAGLLADQGAGGQVPRIEAPLVVGVVAAAAGPAQVQRRRPEAANVADPGEHGAPPPRLATPGGRTDSRIPWRPGPSARWTAPDATRQGRPLRRAPQPSTAAQVSCRARDRPRSRRAAPRPSPPPPTPRTGESRTGSWSCRRADPRPI